MPSSTYFSGGASDWTEHIKDYSTTQDGISLWDQVLTGLQQNLELQTQAVQASTDYDISQAYANYLQNQRQISQASNLGTGFKEQLESNLQSSYQSAFQQAQVNETQELYNVAQAYQDELTNVENQFAEMGETAAGYAGRLFEYASQYGKYVPGYENINWSGDLQGQGIYVQDADRNLVLSEKGKNVLNYLLLNRVSIPGATEADATSTSFEQWLGETYGDELSGYREYADMIRTGFGMEPGKTSFDQEQFEENRLEEWRQNFEAVIPEELSEYYSGIDMTEEEYRNLTDKYTNIRDFYGVAEDTTDSNWTAKTFTIGDKEYTTYSLINSTTPAGEYGVNDYTELNSKYRDSGLETGDVVYYMGALFVVTKKHGRVYDFAQITSGEDRKKNLAEEGYRREYNRMWRRNEWVKI